MSNLVNPHSQLTPVTLTGTGSAQQMPDNSARTVFIRGAKANTTTLYIGSANSVTAAGAGAVVVDLQPGEGIFMDIKNSNMLWYIAASASPVAYVTVFE